MAKLADLTAHIAAGTTARYKNLETAAVSGYQTMERSIVSGFNAVSDWCIAALFAREGESVSETKARLAAHQ